MAKYINADDLRNAMFHEAFDTDTKMQKWESGCWIRYKLFENVLNAMPSVDVVEVKHGHWRGRKNSFNNIYYLCSLCGGDSPFKANFCPNCGADMRSEK